MKYDVNDLSPKQLALLIAQAQEYAYIEHETWVELLPDGEVVLDDYQDYILYSPADYWDQAGELLEVYKPYISPNKSSITVEILDEVSSVKSKSGSIYASAKHPNNIMIALCRAIVAYHYGYEIEM